MSTAAQSYMDKLALDVYGAANGLDSSIMGMPQDAASLHRVAVQLGDIQENYGDVAASSYTLTQFSRAPQSETPPISSVGAADSTPSFFSRAGDWLDADQDTWEGRLEAAEPYAQAGLGILESYFEGKALEEDAATRAATMRRRGARLVEQADREAQDIEVKHRFADATNRAELASTSLYSGSESYASGTTISNLLENNRRQAEELAKEIRDEGRKSQAEFEQSAQAAQDAAREKAKAGKKGAILGAVGMIAGGHFGGTPGAAIGGALGSSLGKFL